MARRLAPLLAAFAAATAALALVTPSGDGSRTAPPSPPAGPALALGGRAGDLAVGLELRRSGGAVAAEATVLSPDGPGLAGLDVTIGGVAASSCGRGCYRATLPAAGREVAVAVAGRGTARFSLPARWPVPAGDLVARATRVYRTRPAVAWDEVLDSGAGEVLRTRFVEEAPDRLSYRIAGGPEAVAIGRRRWDRVPGGPWRRSAQSRLRLPSPPWGTRIEDASVLSRTPAAVTVAFVDRAALPTWFTVRLEPATLRPLSLTMTTAAHFMTQRYVRPTRSIRRPD